MLSEALPLSRVEQSTTLIKEQLINSFFYMSNDWLEKKTLHEDEWYEKENTKQESFFFFFCKKEKFAVRETWVCSRE